MQTEKKTDIINIWYMDQLYTAPGKDVMYVCRVLAI